MAIPPALRDSILFLGGLLMAVYEIALADPFHPEVLVLAATMMGLPAYLRRDEK